MFKKVFGWVIGLFVLNLVFIACTSVVQPQIQATPSEDLLNNTELHIISFQDSYDGRCVENANDFVKDFCDDDNDGLLNYQELKYKTNLSNPDTDNDGYIDYEEIERAYDPLSFEDLVPEKYKYCDKKTQVWCWKTQAYYKADPEVCENILCDDSGCRDSSYANSNRNFKECQIKAEGARDLINKELAIANWDYIACNVILDEEIKEDCQKELSYILGAINQSEEYCMETFGFSKILKDEELSHAKELQHRCWFAMAVAIEDIEKCSSLDSHIIKDFDSVSCVTKIARLRNDPEICEYLGEIGLERTIPRCLGEGSLPTENR